MAGVNLEELFGWAIFLVLLPYRYLLTFNHRPNAYPTSKLPERT
jgi:hypothetical protein